MRRGVGQNQKMKTAAPLALGLTVLLAAVLNAEPQRKLEATMRVSTLTAADGTSIGEVRIEWEGQTNAFTSTNALCNFLATLPADTTVNYWAAYQNFHLLIGTNKMHLRHFGKLCNGTGVRLNAMVPDL